MGDNLYFIESIYTPADSTNSVVTLFPTKEEEQAVIVRNLEEGQLKMHNHRGTIREGWYVYVDEVKQVPFGYGNLSLYARGQFRDYYALRNQLAERLITADSEGAIVPSCFQDPKTKVTSYHVNVGHGNRKDAKGTGQWHSEGTSDILRAIKMVVDAFDIMVRRDEGGIH